MTTKPMFIFVATYDSLDDAKSDENAVKQLYRDHAIGTYDAALLSRDQSGKVHVHKIEKPAQHGAAIGAVAGAVIGVLFPPFVLADAGIGALAGGLIGHLRKGLPHVDQAELGALLAGSPAGLVVVGQSKLKELLAKELKHAKKQLEKELNVDVDELQKDLAAAS